MPSEYAEGFFKGSNAEIALEELVWNLTIIELLKSKEWFTDKEFYPHLLTIIEKADVNQLKSAANLASKNLGYVEGYTQASSVNKDASFEAVKAYCKTQLVNLNASVSSAIEVLVETTYNKYFLGRTS